MTVIKRAPKHFNTPIEVGTKPIDSKAPLPPGSDIADFLEKRRQRLLAKGENAELEAAIASDEAEAARFRKDKERLESKGAPEEADMEKRVKDAAEVAAEAVNAGVDTEEAKQLATGDKKVVITKPKSASTQTGEPTAGGWSVQNGKPVKDPEGEYTFSQALRVCELERPKGTDTNSPVAILDWADKRGLLGPGKSDEFMTKFLTELATRSVDSLVKPPPPNTSGNADALRAELKELREEIKLANDPIQAAKKVQDLYNAWKTLGLIKEGTGGTGESIESLREKNRHEEEMSKLQNEKEHNESLSDLAGDAVERVGRGIAHQWREEAGGEKGTSGEEGGKIPFTCTEESCKTEFLIPLDATQVKCPKCGAIYAKKGEKPA